MRRRRGATAAFGFAWHPVLVVGWLAQCGLAYALAWVVDGIELDDLTDDEVVA